MNRITPIVCLVMRGLKLVSTRILLDEGVEKMWSILIEVSSLDGTDHERNGVVDLTSARVCTEDDCNLRLFIIVPDASLFVVY